jgi:uncharacterized protein DUF1353
MRSSAKLRPTVLLCSLLACIALILAGAPLARADKLGQFKGDLILKPLSDGRTMELVQPFSYLDSHGVTWPVPAGTKVDGASIPSAFWSILGAPYTGKYREASIIHDHYCATKSRHWKAVHKVFFDGMMARGVEAFQAQLMYLAVYRFGPRWDFDVDACFCKGCPVCANPILKRVSHHRPKYVADDFEDLRRKLASRQFTLDQLEDIADYQLNTEILKRR